MINNIERKTLGKLYKSISTPIIMTDFLESWLKKLAYFQKKNAVAVLIITLIVTLFLAFGLTKFAIESDIQKGMPQDLPIFKVNDKISDKFGGQDIILVVVQLDEESGDKDAPVDIRDPRVIKFLMELEKNLKQEDLIENVQSVGSIFNQFGEPKSLEQVRTVLSNVPNSDMFFNKDYSVTLLYIATDVGTDQDKIKELINVVSDGVEVSMKPVGIKTSITGTPPMMVTLLDLMVKDAVFTLALAALVILMLLIIMEKSFTKAILIFFPLIIGIVWTLGTMGWLDIKLSIATVGIGAMILGLGVEYGTFLVTRYKEERKKHNQLNSLEIAVSGIGSSILGSGLTTIVGFLALTFSVMPMLSDLGVTLALGIGFCLFIAIFVSPSIIILEENFERWITHRRHAKHFKKLEEHKNKKWD